MMIMVIRWWRDRAAMLRTLLEKRRVHARLFDEGDGGGEEEGQLGLALRQGRQHPGPRAAALGLRGRGGGDALAQQRRDVADEQDADEGLAGAGVQESDDLHLRHLMASRHAEKGCVQHALPAGAACPVLHTPLMPRRHLAMLHVMFS